MPIQTFHTFSKITFTCSIFTPSGSLPLPRKNWLINLAFWLIKLKRYKTNPERKRRTTRKQYGINPEPKRRTTRKQYKINPELKRRTSLKQYRINPEPKRRTARKQYSTNSESKKRAACKQYNNHPWRNKVAPRVCHALNLDSICAKKRAKYALGEPKLDVKDMYVKEILSHLLPYAEVRSVVSDSFPKMHINNKINVYVKAMCRVAAQQSITNSQGACRLFASSCKISAKHGTH